MGLIIAPTSFPFLGFTLSAVLQTLIPSIIVRNIKDDYSKYLEKVIKVVLVLLAVGACVYVFSLEQVTISKQVVDITFNIKVFISVLCVIMVSVLFMVMYYYKKEVK